MSGELCEVQAIGRQPGTRRPTRAAVVVALSLGMLLTGWVEIASAKTFRVNSRRDKVDADPGDGRCDANLDRKGKQCTLRAASQEAAFDEDTYDLIRVPKGVYKLTISSDSNPDPYCPDDSCRGDIDLRGKTSIVGAGPFRAIVDAKKAPTSRSARTRRTTGGRSRRPSESTASFRGSGSRTATRPPTSRAVGR